MFEMTTPSADESADSAMQKNEPRSSNQPRVLIKYGGNAMIDPSLIKAVVAAIVDLHRSKVRIVLVHGGGPYIRALLDLVGHKSQFIGGHRKTDQQTIRYVSMVLCGQVNGELVSRLNAAGARAVGINGRDAGFSRVVRRRHIENPAAAEPKEQDLGFVGDITGIDPRLVNDLLALGYLPVVAPISSGPDGQDYNVNADMFAGHLAAALQVDDYLVLTDVDGLRQDKDDPGSLIGELGTERAAALLGTAIAGGMIPKVESCLVALEGGVSTARILNGTKPRTLQLAIAGEQCGTVIRRDLK
jgi:acetylglutamate kinase